MDLHAFFPYRLAVLAEAVSQATAQVYRERFSLTRDEWRVLAALADLGEVKTSRVIDHTTLEKMRVSRALGRLEADALVGRVDDPSDGRGYLVHLLPAGQALFRKVVPMVQAREAFLLETLTKAEREALDKALSKVLERAQQLTRQG